MVVTNIVACKHSRPSSTQILGDPVISSCDLTKRPDAYNARTVHVRGILVGYHELALYNPACDSNVKYIRADFDAASRRKLVDRIATLDGAGSQRGNFWATVVLDGTFENIPGADCQKTSIEPGLPDRRYVNFCYRLAVSDVSDVSAVPADVEWPK